MQKIAVTIVAVGFVFVFYSLPAFGIDLLLDPVGFLLIWNGLRALRKRTSAFSIACVSSLLLIFVSSLQLFVSEITLFWVSSVRILGMLALFASVSWGYGKYLINTEKAWNIMLFYFVSTANMIVTICFFAALLFDTLAQPILLINQIAYYFFSFVFILLIKFSRFKALE